MSLRNVGLNPNYMALQTGTPYSSLGLMLVRKKCGGSACRWQVGVTS
jgi:hypothetical protein